MADQPFPTLFSPLEVGPVTLRNRIVSSGHATRLADGQVVSDRLRAYHRARAAGGAGLIITEASFLTRDASYSSAQLVCADDTIVPTYRALGEELRSEGCAVFGQLLHLGLEHASTLDGTRVAALGPTASPSERYHTSGRAMTLEDIDQVVDDHAAAAERMRRGGLDGVEVAASHGYLLAQFLSPRLNRRTDEYGGSLENRLRLTRRVLLAVRAAAGPDLAVGIRISGDEMTTDGLEPHDVVEACAALGTEGLVDYFNVTIGSSRQVAAAVHIVSPMSTEMAISTTFSERVKRRVAQPVLAVGRINSPALAEQVLESGRADLVGMTRAMICDPEMPTKARDGRADEIRTCIACNQACIDRFHRGHGISCIQHPETGRELTYRVRTPASQIRRVMVVGGGPAGLKAAVVAAERGHDVTLFEKAARLGGQALWAEQLPRRAEFGGLIENLAREAEAAGVMVELSAEVTPVLVQERQPDVVIVATGASAGLPRGEFDGAHIVTAVDVLRGCEVGKRVLVADWKCDWAGLGMAELLARRGHRVTLASTGYIAGETIPRYTRDEWLADMHRLDVNLIPLTRLFGADEDTVYLQHMASGEPVIVEGIDSVVSAGLAESNNELAESLAGMTAVHVIGDALAPRTVEEATLDALEIASAL